MNKTVISLLIIFVLASLVTGGVLLFRNQKTEAEGPSVSGPRSAEVPKDPKQSSEGPSGPRSTNDEPPSGPAAGPQSTDEPTTTTDEPKAREAPEPKPSTSPMCVYTNSYTPCDATCGPGKRFRIQIPYTESTDVSVYGLDPASVTPHPCVDDAQREHVACEGVVCDDTYTLQTFQENNPGKSYDDYCEFIVSENACATPFVATNSLCSSQCNR